MKTNLKNLQRNIEKEFKVKEKDENNWLIKDRHFYHHNGNSWNNPARFKGKAIEFYHREKIEKDEQVLRDLDRDDQENQKLKREIKKRIVLRRKKQAKEILRKRKIERLCLQQTASQFVNLPEKSKIEFDIATQLGEEEKKDVVLSRNGAKLLFSGAKNSWNDFEKFNKQQIDLVFTPQVISGERRAIKLTNDRIELDEQAENIRQARKKEIHDEILSRMKTMKNSKTWSNAISNTGRFTKKGSASNSRTSSAYFVKERNLKSGLLARAKTAKKNLLLLILER